MALFLKSDYEGASATCQETISNIQKSLNSVASKIEDYCNQSKDKLVSESFNVLFQNMYNSAENLKSLSNKLGVVTGNIVSCNSSVIGAMNGEPEISDDLINELELELKMARSLYYRISAQLIKSIFTNGDTNGLVDDDLKRSLNNTKMHIIEIENRKNELKDLLVAVSNADSTAANSLSDDIKVINDTLLIK